MITFQMHSGISQRTWNIQNHNAIQGGRSESLQLEHFVTCSCSSHFFVLPRIKNSKAVGPLHSEPKATEAEQSCWTPGPLRPFILRSHSSGSHPRLLSLPLLALHGSARLLAVHGSGDVCSCHWCSLDWVQVQTGACKKKQKLVHSRTIGPTS